MYSRLSVLVALLLLLVSVAVTITVKAWLYKMPIAIIERSGHDLYNYSVAITYDFRKYILAGEVRLDLGDIRFFDSSGRELPYWIESASVISPIYDYSYSVGTAQELIIYAVVNGDKIYGMNAIPLPSRIWVFYLKNNTLRILYSNSTDRFTMWQAIYNETEGKIYAVGQIHFSSLGYSESAIFIIDVRTNNVTYVIHHGTRDVNEFIAVEEYGNYLFVGERDRAGVKEGSLYPNGGGVWKIPKATITNTSTWRRIWEDPYGREIRAIKRYKGTLYVLAVPGEGYGRNVTLYKYDPARDTLVEVKTFNVDYRFDYPAFMDAGKYLYIAIDNASTGTIHILAFDGSSIVEDFDTGIPNYHTVRILVVNINGQDVIFLGTDRGDIYAIVWSSKRVLRLGTIPMKHTDYGGISRATFNKYAFDPSTLTLYPTEAYYRCRIYAVRFGVAKIWVKVPFIPAFGVAKIYMYFGDLSVPPPSYTARDVFLWWDDFLANTTTQYEPVPGHFSGVVPSINVSGGVLNVTIGGYGHGLVLFPVETTQNIIIEGRVRLLSLGINSQFGFVFHGSTEDVIGRYIDGECRRYFITVQTDTSDSSIAMSGEEYIPDTEWHLLKFIWLDNGSLYLYSDGELVASATHKPADAVYRPGLFIGYDAGTTVQWDWIRVRPFVYPEPLVKIGEAKLTVNVALRDLDLRELGYLNLTLYLVNVTSGRLIRTVVGKGKFTLTGLTVGTYNITVKFMNITICAGTLNLNVTLNETTINLTCNVKKILDYRNTSRIIAWSYGVELLQVKSLSTKYPYSRMEILLNGTGQFTVYIWYGEKRPTKVSVTGNVTDLQYHLDREYLVISGVLGSVGVLNITDLYRLRVEARDRLGRLMPAFNIIVNSAPVRGPVAELFVSPGVYSITVPVEYNNFKLYGWSIGVNASTVSVEVTDHDVVVVAYYRVPVKFKDVALYRLVQQWWAPLVFDVGQVPMYIEGWLKDYYGVGVPDRPVVIVIVDLASGNTTTLQVKTDSSGHFRSPALQFYQNKTYSITLIFPGDDTYLNATFTVKVTPQEVTPSLKLDVLIGGIIAAVTAATVTIAVMKALSPRTRRFVVKRPRHS